MTVSTSSAGGIVQNEEGEVLIVAQRGDVWSLPKGHIDPGEDELTAAKREIHEESGVLPESLILHSRLGEYTRFKIGPGGVDAKSESKTLIFFHFSTQKVVLKPIDPFNPEAKWVDKKDVTSYLTHPKDIDFYQSVIPLLH